MMTARDTAKLAAALIHNHPDVLNISGRTQMQLKDKGLYVSNSNLMLKVWAALTHTMGQMG